MLDLPLSKLGVNRTRINALKTLGVETLYDLVTYYPRKVIVPAVLLKGIYDAERYSKDELKSGKAVLDAKILDITLYPPRGRMRVGRLLLRCQDLNKQRFEVVFFAKSMRYLKWLESKYLAGDEVIIRGVPKPPSKSSSFYQFSHPEVFVVKAADANPTRRDFASREAAFEHFSKPRTVYAATKRLTSARIAQTIQDVITRLESRALVEGEGFASTDELPLFPNVQAGRSRWQAIKHLHAPETMQQYEEALAQLKFEEAYVLQVLLAKRRSSMLHLRSRARVYDARGALSVFDANLPFRLTRAQQKVSQEIADDLSKTIPMQRLLQGDVGSGKTVVALRAMLQVVDNGGQAVLLAPTEVLANQHYASIARLLGELNVHGVRSSDKLGVQVELLTGALSARAKRSVEEGIRSGMANIIVGTHALLHRKNIFKDLGIVVVDEQHRFGVRQRDKLREQSEDIPHMLVMTATPIPRSVAMFLFADLQVSVLDEMPLGRGEVQTHIVSAQDKRLVTRMWQRVREEIDAGRNVFVIAPRIDDVQYDEVLEEVYGEAYGDVPEGSPPDYAEPEAEMRAEDAAMLSSASGGEGADEIEQLPQSIFEKLLSAGLEETLGKHAQSVQRLSNDLAENPALKGVRVGILHGRLTSEEKELAMCDFEAMKTPLLIATSVVEVGIDIPNAACTVITDADKFGMASLHQLRGRIGRGSEASICFLLTSEDGVSADGGQRIKTIAKYQDGFKIAKADLSIRKEGDIMGKFQSGSHSSLKLLRVIEDQDIITQAMELATQTLKQDPELKRHPGLDFAVARELTEQAKDFLSKS